MGTSLSIITELLSRVYAHKMQVKRDKYKQKEASGKKMRTNTNTENAI